IRLTALVAIFALTSSVLNARMQSSDDALAARCFEYFNPERPDVAQAEQYLEQVAERYKGSEEDIDIQKQVLKRLEHLLPVSLRKIELAGFQIE
ncbi:MAG: hypothetical protein ACKOCG_02595, partial [Candidatus Nanopelagicus sp.]